MSCCVSQSSSIGAEVTFLVCFLFRKVAGFIALNSYYPPFHQCFFGASALLVLVQFFLRFGLVVHWHGAHSEPHHHVTVRCQYITACVGNSVFLPWLTAFKVWQWLQMLGQRNIDDLRCTYFSFCGGFLSCLMSTIHSVFMCSFVCVHWGGSLLCTIQRAEKNCEPCGQNDPVMEILMI